MNPIGLIIIAPLKASSKLGCLGPFVAIAYIIILATGILYAIGSFLGGGSSVQQSEDCCGQQVYTPTTSSQSYPSTSSVAVSLHNQGYNIRQIRKYLKENGYGDYTRGEVKQLLGQ